MDGGQSEFEDVELLFDTVVAFLQIDRLHFTEVIWKYYMVYLAVGNLVLGGIWRGDSV